MQVIFTPTLPDAFERAGLPFPGDTEAGRLRRFATNGQPDDQAGWLRVFPDGDGAVFGNWRESSAYTWQRERAGPPPSPAELAKIRANAERIQKEAEAEREAAYQKAAEKAAATYKTASPVNGNAYLSAKGIGPHIARERGGWLVVPVFDAAGNIQSIQSVGPTGEKRFMPDGKVKGGRCWLGEPTNDAPLVICEGFATGATIHEATGWPVCVAFNAGNLHPVAVSIREQYARAKIVVAGDDDRATAGNPGRQKALAAAKVVNARTVFPTFAGPEGSDFNDMAQQAGNDAVRDAMFQAVGISQRFRLLTAAELSGLPPLDYRIKRVLPMYGLAAFYGASGTGKTFLVLDAAMSAAGGLDWFGYRSKSCPVVYVGLEGSAGLPQRIKAYRIVRGANAGRNVRFITAPLSVLESGDVADLAASIRAARAGEGMVVIDTLNAAAPGADENSSEDMGRIIAAAKVLQADIGGLVILVHHTGKDATKGLRGHSSLFAALDAAIEVTRDGDRREWRLAKSKDGEDGKTHPFKLAVVELGTDADGDPITSCIVEPDQTPGESMRKAKAPGGGNMRIVYDAIQSALKMTKDFGKGEAPQGVPCIELEALIVKASGLLTCDEKRRRERVQSAVMALVLRGNIKHQGGWIWTA